MSRELQHLEAGVSQAWPVLIVNERKESCELKKGREIRK